MNLPIAFIRWRSEVPSGGNRYDDELTFSLRSLGIDVHEHLVTGSWPFPDQGDREKFHTMLLRQVAAGRFHWLIDNIVAAAVPETIRAVVESGHSVSIIMHYFASDERGVSPARQSQIAVSEAAAVTAASQVIATSEWTAREVTRRYGREDIAVALPGVEPARIAPGSLDSDGAPTFLWLARVSQTKDPTTFVAALTHLRDLDWRARVVGPDTIDLDLSRSVRTQIARAGLSARIDMTGPVIGSALEAIWSGTDLLAHTAHTEAYGMVVTEALARGIPSIVPRGTGAVEAQQGAGGLFLPGDQDGLSTLMREWLTSPGLRERWQTAAATRRATLPTWHAAAHTVATTLVTSSLPRHRASR